jgi:adenylate cyclase
VAEVELPSASTPLTLPPFVGKEVSGDPAYYNSNL